MSEGGGQRPLPVDVAHALNELCDFSTSALQWLVNINDGVSSPAMALENLKAQWERVRPLAYAAHEYARRPQPLPPI